MVRRWRRRAGRGDKRRNRSRGRGRQFRAPSVDRYVARVPMRFRLRIAWMVDWRGRCIRTHIWWRGRIARSTRSHAKLNVWCIRIGDGGISRLRPVGSARRYNVRAPRKIPRCGGNDGVRRSDIGLLRFQFRPLARGDALHMSLEGVYHARRSLWALGAATSGLGILLIGLDSRQPPAGPYLGLLLGIPFVALGVFVMGRARWRVAIDSVGMTVRNGWSRLQRVEWQDCTAFRRLDGVGSRPQVAGLFVYGRQRRIVLSAGVTLVARRQLDRLAADLQQAFEALPLTPESPVVSGGFGPTKTWNVDWKRATSP
jgi:hypothetical protein